ncbi:MAG: tyrosine-protein phosphatase [Gaiellaceae bacterium]
MTSLVWEGCLNVRDLGGAPTEDGRRTRLGAVVRSDDVCGLTADGRRSLIAHGVVRIVDLR